MSERERIGDENAAAEAQTKRGMGKGDMESNTLISRVKAGTIKITAALKTDLQ